jgi:osmotically inducible protein OsmC
MKISKAQAVWTGNLKEGSGQMSFDRSGISFPFSFKSRFENGDGANPEMLIGAAHAGCFSMAFAAMLAEQGYTPGKISTDSEIKLDSSDDGMRIVSSHLTAEAEVDGIDEETFLKIAAQAKEGCPVSRALGTVQITLDARLKK